VNRFTKESLTPEQRRFVAEYIVDFNATQAAFAAGYSKKTAREQECRLLTNVHVPKL
jgi:phage terminase small subunit